MTQQENIERLAKFMWDKPECPEGFLEYMLERFNPYLNIADAMMIVEKLNETHGSVAIWQYPELRDGYKSVCFIGTNDEGNWKFGATGKDTQDAICEAALKVIEE